MVDVTAVSVRFTIGAPCNKTTIRQDHQGQASVFHRQINLTDVSWSSLQCHGSTRENRLFRSSTGTEFSDSDDQSFKFWVTTECTIWMCTNQETKLSNNDPRTSRFVCAFFCYTDAMTIHLNKNTEPEEVVINISGSS